MPTADKPTSESPATSKDEATAAPVEFATGGPVSDAVPVPLTGCSYRFTHFDTTIYPALGVTAEFGDVHDWPDGPPNDGRWTPATEGA